MEQKQGLWDQRIPKFLIFEFENKLRLCCWMQVIQRMQALTSKPKAALNAFIRSINSEDNGSTDSQALALTLVDASILQCLCCLDLAAASTSQPSSGYVPHTNPISSPEADAHLSDTRSTVLESLPCLAGNTLQRTRTRFAGTLRRLPTLASAGIEIDDSEDELPEVPLEMQRTIRANMALCKTISGSRRVSRISHVPGESFYQAGSWADELALHVNTINMSRRETLGVTFHASSSMRTEGSGGTLVS